MKPVNRKNPSGEEQEVIRSHFEQGALFYKTLSF